MRYGINVDCLPVLDVAADGMSEAIGNRAYSRDPQAVAVVEEVDAERLACACRLFLACGIEEKEAQARSLMLYAYVFGVSLMRCGGFTSDIESLKAWIAERIAR